MSDFDPGHTIGDYRILTKLGDGGYGSVYLALDKNGKKIALKTRDSQDNDPEEIRRFIHECEVLSKINHPNIINCIESGFDNDVLYLALDYIDGEDLKESINEYGPIPYKEATFHIRLIAGAIKTLIKNDIVHRDIKAENIILSTSGEIKLVDFGLALSPALGIHERPDDVYGTAQYIAPEYALGGGLTDLYSGVYDIYSLGITYYCLLMADYPFLGTTTDILRQHIKTDPPTIPNVSDSVNMLYKWMLTKNPDNRATPEQVISLCNSIIAGD
jgi:eukaryotic-like serine/threonine-protein kinase